MIYTIISYCSNDYKFISECINSARLFSTKIIVVVSTHYFNGCPENRELIQLSINNNSDDQVEFIELKYDGELDVDTRFWHNQSRQSGIDWINSTATSNIDEDYILFLDADEILDAVQFYKWIQSSLYMCYNAIIFACYWYFREVNYQSTTLETIGLLIKRGLSCTNIFNDNERRGMFLAVDNTVDNVLSLYGMPMAHHYSWVRNKDEMIKKVETWGHNNDKNWIELVEEEFSREFNGTDFVHGYEYNILK